MHLAQVVHRPEITAVISFLPIRADKHKSLIRFLSTQFLKNQGIVRNQRHLPVTPISTGHSNQIAKEQNDETTLSPQSLECFSWLSKSPANSVVRRCMSAS